MKHCSSVVGELQVRLRMGIVPEELCYEARRERDELWIPMTKGACSY